MQENFIKDAAQLYYKEYVEGEPLDQDTPIECFIAGSEFILNTIKKHQNNYNLSDYSSYNFKKNNMGDITKLKKMVENIEKINKVTGFYITAPGDSSVGIEPATWELKNDFYFDTPEELEEFRKELQSLFEFYCGENIKVLTFEENQIMFDLEEERYYEEFPVRYLIRDKDYNLNLYKKANHDASYSTNIGEGIHNQLPSWIPEEGTYDTEVIKSTEPRFKEILLREIERLENEIRNKEHHLNNTKKNLRLIQQELKYSQK